MPFKVYRGTEANLPSSKNDGFVYFCTDTSSLYIDWADANKTVHRSHIGGIDLEESKSYTDEQILAMVGSSTVASQISAAVANKVEKVSGKGLSTNDYTTTEKNKLAGIASGAQVNQNAFSNIVVGSTTISSDTATDTLTLVGSNVTLTPDATNDTVTIGITKSNVTTALGYTPPTTNTTYDVVSTTANGLAPKRDGSTTKFLRGDGTWAVPPDNNTTYGVVSTTADGLAPKRDGSTTKFLRADGAWAVPPDNNTVYTHPTSSGNKHIPSGGSSGQILRWSADGTAVWGNDNNTTYGAAGSSLGLVKTGGDVSIADGVITVNDDSHNHVISNIDGLQSALDGKAASSHGTHVTFSTTAPVVAGTASVGSASSVSRSDHVHPAQTSVSGNAGSATKWATARNINGMSVNGEANRFNYGSCSTAAGTAAKTVACTGFSLATGSEITVKFTVTNTASNPTLNVNSTGAKSIYYRGAAISAGYLAANRTYTFRYNGTQYDLVGDLDTQRTVDSSMSTSSTNPVQNKVVKAAIDAIRAVPACTTSNNGQFLRVVNGAAAWQTIASAESASF